MNKISTNTFTVIENSKFINFDSIKQKELLKVADEALRLIKENERNKFISLDLLTFHIDKLGLPSFLAYGMFAEISDIASHQSSLNNSSMDNQNKSELIENDFAIKNSLVASIIELSSLILNKEIESEFFNTYEKTKNTLLNKLKVLIDSITDSYSNNTDSYKEELRHFIESELELPAIVSTGILTEFFYNYFKNITLKLPESIFEGEPSGEAISFIKYLRDFASETSEAVAKICILKRQFEY